MVLTPRAVNQIPTTGHAARKKCSERELLKDADSVAVATILDDKINQRIDAVFREHWNTTLRKYVNARISEEVADQALLLGKRMGELHGKRGEL